MIEKYLEKLNAIMDPNRTRDSEELQRKAANYEMVHKLPLLMSTYDDMSKERYPVFLDWPVYNYGEAYRDPEKMLLNELLPVYEGEIFKDNRVNVIRANYGVGIIPSLFSCESVQKDNDLPWVKKVESMEDVKKMLSKGVPDFNSSLLRKVNEAQESRIAGAPVCRRSICAELEQLKHVYGVGMIFHCVGDGRHVGEGKYMKHS